jgi:hypothetical protein
VGTCSEEDVHGAINGLAKALDKLI